MFLVITQFENIVRECTNAFCRRRRRTHFQFDFVKPPPTAVLFVRFPIRTTVELAFETVRCTVGNPNFRLEMGGRGIIQHIRRTANYW